MARQLSQAITAEFPEYVELTALLRMAAQTWPRYGISAGDLAELDPWTVEVLRVIIGE